MMYLIILLLIVSDELEISFTEINLVDVSLGKKCSMNTDYVKYNQASYTASYLVERDHISSAEKTELSSVRLLFKSQDLT